MKGFLNIWTLFLEKITMVCKKHMSVLELVNSNTTLYRPYICVFRNQHENTNLTMYNMTIFEKKKFWPNLFGPKSGFAHQDQKTNLPKEIWVAKNGFRIPTYYIFRKWNKIPGVPDVRVTL